MADSFFNLHTRVFVSKNADFQDFALINVGDIIESFSPYHFVGVGYPPQNVSGRFNGPVYPTPYDMEMDPYDPDCFLVMLCWPLHGTYVSYPNNTGVMFTYLREGMSEPIKLWRVDPEHTYPSWYDNYDGKEVTVYFMDDEGNTVGKIVFECETYDSRERDVEKSPFRIDEVTYSNGTFYLLCYNSDDNTFDEAEGKFNGKNWECSLYIIDPDSPAYERNNPEIRSLELPSVYKPFYMRSRIIIENEMNTKGCYSMMAFSNVYNGIGFYYDNEYKIGSFFNKVNDYEETVELTGNTPALLTTYEQSVHTITGYTSDSAVTSLNNINISYRVSEIEIPEGYSYVPFSKNTIDYNKTVSFYNYNYTIGFGEGEDDTFHMTFYSYSFKGESSNDVKYFIIPQYAYQKVVSGNCSSKQIFELTPEIADYNEKSIDDKTCWGFLSLYGLAGVEKLSNYNPDHGFGFRNKAVLIDRFDFSKDGETFKFYKFDGDNKNENWHVIGITDPLIDLLTQDEDLFYKEYETGSVLAPHQNFVSIITYK